MKLVALALVFGVSAAGVSEASAQLIRFNSQQLYIGNFGASLRNSAGVPVPFVAPPALPEPTFISNGGQTGGGFEDGGVLVGECAIVVTAAISDSRSVWPELTFVVDARSWFAPGYQIPLPQGNSAVLTSEDFHPSAAINNFTISGASSVAYSISSTGNIPLSQFRIYPLGSSTPISGPTIAPGTYRFEMDGISIGSSPSFPSSFKQGTWTFTLPSPGAASLLLLSGVGVSRRKR